MDPGWTLATVLVLAGSAGLIAAVAFAILLSYFG